MAQDLPSSLRNQFLGTLAPPAPGLLFPQEVNLGRCRVHCKAGESWTCVSCV